MSPRLSRLLLASLTACTGLLSCSLAHAQVGPSKSNVKKPAPKPAPRKAPPKKPAPKKSPDVPVVRVRTVPPKPKVARTRPKPPATAARPPAAKPPVATVRIKPPIRVPRPNSAAIAKRAAEAEAKAARERLRVAAGWQQEELSAFDSLAQLAAQVGAVPIDRVPIPKIPTRPAAPPGRTTYLQKVTLLFVREDGQPFTGALASRTPSSLKLSESGNRMELAGPRPGPNDALLQLALPPDWGFVNLEEARIALGDYPGREEVVEEPIPPTPRRAMKPDPLFASAEEEQDALKAIPPVAHKRPGGGAYARPAAGAVQALGTLALVRDALDRPAPPATKEARLKRWSELQRARLLLEDAGLSLSEARALTRDFNPTAPQSVLKAEYRLDYTRLGDLFGLADLRAAQYRAEFEWLLAGLLDPGAPNRTKAIQALAEAPEAVIRNPEVVAQLARYKEAAEAEGRYRTLLESGALDPPPARNRTVTRHLARTVVVQRTSYELRFAEADLRRGDRVTLGSIPVSFDLREGYWVAKVPRTSVRPGDRLQVRRGTGESETMGELPLAQLNAYASAGNLLKLPEMKAVGMPRVAVMPPPVIPTPPPVVPVSPSRLTVTAGPLGEVPLFRELSPELLRTLRREGEETEEKDGSSWISLRSALLSLHLQRIGAEPEGEKGKKKPEGRMRVVGVRMEGPAAGEVGGIRVGSSSRAVEGAFGIPVERTGSVNLANGAVQIVLREGIVQQILVTREVSLDK